MARTQMWPQREAGRLSSCYVRRVYVNFVLPDGRTVRQLVAYHLVPQPNAKVDLEGGTYRVVAVNMQLSQTSSEAHVMLAPIDATTG